MASKFIVVAGKLEQWDGIEENVKYISQEFDTLAQARLDAERMGRGLHFCRIEEYNDDNPDAVVIHQA